MKEEMAEAADQRDAAMLEYQENVRQRIRQTLDKYKSRRRYKSFRRFFRAFPDMMPPPATALTSPDHGPSSHKMKAMLAPHLSVADYLWLEVKDFLLRP